MKNNFLDNKVVLITGGTGSFGTVFVKESLKTQLKKIIVLSRDEYKQFHMKNEIKDKRLNFVLADVRNLDSLEQNFKEVDIVIHAAALKQIPLIEENPYEAVKTNIIGVNNVIVAALKNNVSKVILISSDKAVYPVNHYGATKLCAEKLFIQANCYSSSTEFIIVRYGNVFGSRGSIVERLIKDSSIKEVKITHPEMTRFWFTLKEAYKLVLFALENGSGGEIFIPKISSMKVTDLFDALVPDAKQEVVGIRYGEKLHEILITEYEANRTYELENHYVIEPELTLPYYSQFIEGKKVEKNFLYSSDKNNSWLTKKQIQQMFKDSKI